MAAALDDSVSESDDDAILGRNMLLSPEQRQKSDEKQRALQKLVPLESTLGASSGSTAGASSSSSSSRWGENSVLPSTKPPLLSGSLLGGGRTGSGTAAGVTGIKGTAQGEKERKPLFASELVVGRDAAAAAAETAAAARRTVDAAATIKKESVQCNHCLRRLPKQEFGAHIGACELRTEMCPRGCGASVRFLKMEQHLATTCSKKM